ncbi:MAG: SpoIIE family protein phosphatase [Bacteroidia bacterium]|nr:SpoIIE family protein phosphatase [Bacteroidia bacterium]
MRELRCWLWVMVGMGLGLWAQERNDCSACRENPTCIGECAYRLLLDAQNEREQAAAYILLAQAWIKGGLIEGVPNLLQDAFRRLPSGDSLYFWAVLTQALHYYKVRQADSALFLYSQVANAENAPPFLRAYAYLSMAIAHAEREPLKAAGYAASAEELLQKAPHPILLALTLNALSYAAAAQRDYTRAIALAQKARTLLESLSEVPYFPLLEPRPTIYTAILANLASLYIETNNLSQAQTLYEQALTWGKEQKDTVGIAQAYLGLAQVALLQKRPEVTEALLKQGEAYKQALPVPLQVEWGRTQAQVYLYRRQYDQAIALYDRLMEWIWLQTEAVLAARTTQWQVLSGITQRESQLQLAKQQQEKERVVYALVGGIFLLLLGITGYLAYQNRRRAREEKLFREKVSQQAQEIDQKNQQLARQAQELTRMTESLLEAMEELKQSYTAAERLQRAILPDIEAILPKSAIIFRPLQEVGGDFYTLAADAFSKRLLFAVGDCTGHGISGAILAGIVSTNIQALFFQNPLQSPSVLLSRLLQSLQRLIQVGEKEIVRQGAEVVLGIADFEKRTLHIGLAGRPLWFYREGADALEELDGGRLSIEAATPTDYEFPSYTFTLQEQITFYAFSDGVTDVLSPAMKRPGKKGFRQFLLGQKVVFLPVKRQKEMILEWLVQWQGDAPANDDKTLLILPMESLREYGRVQMGALIEY